ncbi:MAG: ABC transporter permease [Clostridia bacterium]|nr:ABC transporter permease [Clostridia bacterium]
MVHECVVMSIDNILGNRVRSFLTLLGIMIGVAAVIALISTVDGVSASMTSQFLELGANTLTVSVTGTDEKAGMTPEDLQKIVDLNEVDGIVPTVSTRAYVVSGGQISDERLTVAGKNGYYFQITEDLVERGRVLNALDDEYKTWVCMVSKDVVDEFFFAKDPIGKTIYISGLPFEIVGLYEEDSGGGVAALFAGQPDVLIPYTTAMRLNSTNVVTSFSVYMTDGYESSEVQEAVENAMDPIFSYEEDTFTVTSMESIEEMMQTMLSMMSTMLAGIASIALVVGGIGIMNMMLTTVTERTMEIGLKKALGAMPWQIQMQFLIESFLLSILGGLIGIVLGFVISFALCRALDTEFVISMGAIALGVGFSAAVGILFGWAPARKASKLNPIDALRSL